MSLQWVNEIERLAGDPWLPLTADSGLMMMEPTEVLRLCRAVKTLHAALRAVLGHLVVDDLGLNCELDDECCAGPAVLRAREVLERVEAGTI